mmetsp:Transcript_41732/g.82397  ORF Transcript_41732/g.82397 Transcript_41732/m.82397 type:complete len:123 (+) Transcript_41732:1735-2103(+)
MESLDDQIEARNCTRNLSIDTADRHTAAQGEGDKSSGYREMGNRKKRQTGKRQVPKNKREAKKLPAGKHGSPVFQNSLQFSFPSQSIVLLTDLQERSACPIDSPSERPRHSTSKKTDVSAGS